MWKFAEKAIIFVNGDVIGGQKEFINWAKDRYNFQDFRPLSLYAIIAMEDYKQHMNYQNVSFVNFMQFYSLYNYHYIIIHIVKF